MSTRTQRALNGAYLRLRAQLVDLQEVLSANDSEQLEAMADTIEAQASTLVRLLRAKARRRGHQRPLYDQDHCVPYDAVVRDRYGHLSRRHQDGLWGADIGPRAPWALLWRLAGPLEVVGTYPKTTAPLWPQGLEQKDH